MHLNQRVDSGGAKYYWIYFSENARNVHMSASKYFTLSTKNNRETTESACFACRLSVLYYIIFVEILRNTKNSAQFLLINHKLFKTARNVLMPASIYFSAEYKEQQRNLRLLALHAG